MDQILQGFILITGIAGQMLVAHRNLNGFYWWIACNVAALTVSVWNHLFGMAALYIFYSIMSIYSIWKWKKLDNIEA
ncbi:MAG: nicotinamide mononucleotide transporter [Methylophilus sp.]